MIGRNVERLEVVIIGLYLRAVRHGKPHRDKEILYPTAHGVQRVQTADGAQFFVDRDVDALRTQFLADLRLVQRPEARVESGFQLYARVVDVFTRQRPHIGRQVFEIAQ